ncbi:MAG: thioredoxin domain-containing protein [Verrucomicrobiota bacterium]
MWCLAGSVRAHLTVQTNVFLDLELMDEHVALELWIPTFYFLPLEDITFATPRPYPQSEERTKAILEYLAEKCPVTIDGVVTLPEMESLDYLPIERGLHLGEERDYVHAKMRIRYPFEGEPKKVSCVWGIFVPEPDFGWDAIWDGQGHPQDLQLVFVRGRTPIPVTFSPDEPEYIWHAPLDGSMLFADPIEVEIDARGFRLPTVSVVFLLLALGFLWFTRRVPDFTAVRVLGGAALFAGAVFFQSAGLIALGGGESLAESEAKTVFAERMKSAFLSPDQAGAAEPLRERLRAEIGQSLIMRDQGGAEATATDLEVISAELEPLAKDPGFDVSAVWRLLGGVEHWGHQHAFAKEFEGQFKLAPVGGDWLLAGIEVRSEKRLNPVTLKPVIPGMDGDSVPRRRGSATGPPDDAREVSLPLDRGELPMVGSEEAPVRMVVFTDFTCPHCRDLHVGALDDLMLDEVEIGELAVEFCYLPEPEDPRSMAAARLAKFAARRGVFMEDIDVLLFEAAFLKEFPSEDSVRTIIEAWDLDFDEWKATGEIDFLVEASLAEMVQLDSMPTVVVVPSSSGSDVVSGWLLAGRDTYVVYQRVIEAVRGE